MPLCIQLSPSSEKHKRALQKPGRTAAQPQDIDKSPVNFWKSTTTSALNRSNNGNVRKSSSQSTHKHPNWHFYSALLGMMQQRSGNRVLLMKTSSAWRKIFPGHLTPTQTHNCFSAGSEESKNQTTTPIGSLAGRNEGWQIPKHWESMQWKVQSLVEKMYTVVFTKIPEMALIHKRTAFLIKEPAARNPI